MRLSRAACAEFFDGRTGHVHAALPISAEVFPPFLRARTHDRAEVQPPGIAGDKRLREQHQLGALASCVARQGVNFLQGARRD